MRTSIHLSKIKQGPQESLAKFVKRFHQEAVLTPDLEDGVAYTSFLNGLKSGHSKFSFAKQKETTLAKALRKAVYFIRATEICADNCDASKKAKIPGDKNLNLVIGIPAIGKGGHNSRQLTLGLLPTLEVSSWRLGDILCSEGYHP